MLSWSSDLGAVNATDTIYYLWNTARTQNAHMHKGTGWKGWCEFSLADRFLTVNYIHIYSIFQTDKRRLFRNPLCDDMHIIDDTSSYPKGNEVCLHKYGTISYFLSFRLWAAWHKTARLSKNVHIYYLKKLFFFSVSFILPITDPFLTWFQWIEP